VKESPVASAFRRIPPIRLEAGPHVREFFSQARQPCQLVAPSRLKGLLETSTKRLPD
jgi:hypothetical protein